jgi:tRNA-modifying protein YgfZ
MAFFLNVSERAVLAFEGVDSLDFLQRMSTNDLSPVKSGSVVQTALTNEKGRIVDVLMVFSSGEKSLLALCQSNPTHGTASWLEKFIIMEDMSLGDVTDEFEQFMIFDLDSDARDTLAAHLESELICVDEIAGISKIIRVLARKRQGKSLEQLLTPRGFDPASIGQFEEFRVSNGVPAFGAELSDQYNPLEANLSHLISWTKGCYIGQEVIARLDTYKKVQRHLVTLDIDDAVLCPTPFFDEDGEAGTITSCVRVAATGKCRGLGYLKSSRSETHSDFFGMADGVKRMVTIVQR